MSILRFLCDEDLDFRLIDAVRTKEPAMDLLWVGEAGAPPKGTRDSQILLAAESMGRVLLSNDKRTMPRHMTAHFLAGYHTCGVILIRQGIPVEVFLDAIRLIWGASTADEWIDRTDYIPN